MRRVGSAGAVVVILFMVIPLLWLVPVEAQAQGSADPEHEFTIAVGETLTFDAQGIRRVVTGDDTVAEPQISSDRRHLFITGTTPGISTINIFSGGGDEQRALLVRVVSVNPTALADEVREVLGDGAGVDIRVVNGRVLIEGEVSSEVFQEKIDHLTELYPDQVLDFAAYSEALVEGARDSTGDFFCPPFYPGLLSPFVGLRFFVNHRTLRLLEYVATTP